MLEVLYEDNHLIAINKKSGDIVQGDKTGDAPLSDFVKAYIKKKYNKPGDVFLGTIHRLDRPTSGNESSGRSGPCVRPSGTCEPASCGSRRHGGRSSSNVPVGSP